jgi:hypothetical protein
VISASDRSFLVWQPVVNKRAFASLPEPFRLALAKVNMEAKYFVAKKLRGALEAFFT